jgi:hypothetical protein
MDAERRAARLLEQLQAFEKAASNPNPKAGAAGAA